MFAIKRLEKQLLFSDSNLAAVLFDADGSIHLDTPAGEKLTFSTQNKLRIDSNSGESVTELSGLATDQREDRSWALVSFLRNGYSPLHHHDARTEKYYVTSGQARVMIDGQEHLVPKGKCITLHPHQKHQVFSIGEQGNLEMLVQCTPSWTPSDQIQESVSPLTEADQIIQKLALIPLYPEGGYFKEMHRSPHKIKSETHGERDAFTSIYFLLKGDDFSAWHITTSDESLYYHMGCDLNLYLLDEDGTLSSVTLGLESGQFQFTVPANKLVCARPKNIDSFTLLSSAVGPGFEFKDFKLIPQSELLTKFPQHHEIIQEFTREHPHPSSSLKN